jgi:hypothetical protein
LISNIDASEPIYACIKIDEFHHFFKAFPERPKLKQFFLLENLESEGSISSVKIKCGVCSNFFNIHST